MQSKLLAFFLCIVPQAQATEVRCPSQIDVAKVVANPPSGWNTYKSARTPILKNGEVSGGFRNVEVHDGNSADVLGDLIPDNDETGYRDGYFEWSLGGLDNVYAACKYGGTNIWLVTRIERHAHSICRVSLFQRKPLPVLSCK